MVFSLLQKGIEEYTYIIFVVILIASIVFIFFFVPETKNRSFEEVVASIGFGRKGRQPAFGENGEEMQPMGAVKAWCRLNLGLKVRILYRFVSGLTFLPDSHSTLINGAFSCIDLVLKLHLPVIYKFWKIFVPFQQYFSHRKDPKFSDRYV